MKPVKVTAHLASELIGAPPQLDALVMSARARFHPSCGDHERYAPAPQFSMLPPIPIHFKMMAGWRVYCVSAPIISEAMSDRHDHVSQHFPREHASRLHAGQQGTIATTNGAQKSMRLPVRLRVVQRIMWFAMCREPPNRLRKILRDVVHVGQDRSRGGGRVSEWDVEIIEDDLSWYAPHERGTVLMRSLPWCDELPRNLVGCVRDFDAVTHPYWHPERKTEIVRPC